MKIGISLFHCRYFDRSFSEIFVEWSPTKHHVATKRLNLRKILKNQHLRSYMGIKLTLCRNVHSIGLYKKYCFCCCMCTLVAMATGLMMGKMKIGFNCCIIAGILTERF